MMLDPALARPMFIGSDTPRIEDDVLLSGRGEYIADIVLPGALEMAVARSTVAHARITRLDVSAARSLPGVHLVVTAEDLEGVAPYPDFIEVNRPVKQFALARDRVWHVGQAIAVVVADNRYVAEDALELIEVDYEELPVVMSIEEATADGAPRLYDDWPDNYITNVSTPPDPELDQVFSSSRVVRGRYSMQRHTAVPMETRGVQAECRRDRLVVYTSTQSPHIVRTMLHYVLGLPERNIRVIAPDVGGAFGSKCHVYPEDVIVPWLARKLRRPVRWIEDRAEHMVSTTHAREQIHEMEAAIDDDGTIKALRCRLVQDVGSAQVWFPGTNTTFVSSSVAPGPYRIPLCAVTVQCVVTNKTPSGAYRGFGVPEMVFAHELLVEDIAREVGVDSIELRRKMLVRAEDLPYTMATGTVIDSGSHFEAFERAVEFVGEAEARARARYADESNVRIGSAIATFVEGTVPTYFATTGHWTSQDSATVRVDADGSVTVAVGTSTTGQGVPTMIATFAADCLGVPRDQVSVVIGDTDACPYGLGGWGSRSTAVMGGAIRKAADVVRSKALRIASHMLEAAPDDVVVENGEFHVRGSQTPSVSWAQVATTANIRVMDLPEGEEPNLEATAVHDFATLDHVPDERGRMNGAVGVVNATHGGVVKVDVETGEIEILDLIVVHDCGPLINPIIVTGQVHGGVAQGVGGALYEHLAYSAEGQPLATTFMDYLLPTATEVPAMVVEHFESPSPQTPFGVKGAGEGGTIGPAAVLATAVSNALQEFGVRIDATPITPAGVRAAIRASSAQPHRG